MRTRSAIVAFGVALASATVSAQTPPAAGPPPTAAAGRGAARAPASCGPNPPATLKNVAKDSRCFELRTYVVQPGGQGNLDLLHARFRDHTLNFFKKHGITVVGFWQPVARPDALTYLLVFDDAAARDARWGAFQADQEWVKIRAEMAVTIQVESTYMISTDYGPMK